MKFGKFFSKRYGGNAKTEEVIGAAAVKVAMAENEEKAEITDATDEREKDASATSAAIADSASQECLSNDEVREEFPSCDPTEDLIVEVSHRDTASSYESGESYDEEDITYFDNATLSIVSPNNMGLKQGERTNYFHKDVVVSSLDAGMIGLVLRAMYFIPKPCATDHVVLKVEASTISKRDCMLCKGVGLTKEMLPFVPGHEVIGTIQHLGDRAKIGGKFRDGDRVAALSTTGGGNSRFISLPATRLAKISTEVQSSEAVCMIHDYMGALRALRLAKRDGSPFTGKSILVTDGFSAMGQAVVTLANMEGAEIYCCAHESKHAYLASMGVKCLDKNPANWLPKAQGTFDVVIDNSCIDAYSSSWYALKDKGKLICLGPLYKIEQEDLTHGACGIIEVAELQQKWAQIKAKFIMSQTIFLNTETIYDNDEEQFQQDLRYLIFLLERGIIKPRIAELVSLSDVPDAQRLMESGKANGTVVCSPWVED